MSEDTVTDFAVAAYREEGDAWTVAPLPLRMAADLDGLVAGLRQLPAESGALGLVSVADDFCVLLRVRGTSVRLLLSDAGMAEEWPIGRQVLDALDADAAGMDEEDDGQPAPAGDLELLTDLGLPGLELAAILADAEAYPDELLGRVAERLGFGAEFDRAVDGTL